MWSRIHLIPVLQAEEEVLKCRGENTRTANADGYFLFQRACAREDVVAHPPHSRAPGRGGPRFGPQTLGPAGAREGADGRGDKGLQQRQVCYGPTTESKECTGY